MIKNQKVLVLSGHWLINRYINVYWNSPLTAGYSKESSNVGHAYDDAGSIEDDKEDKGNDIDDSKCPRVSADPKRRTMGVSECDDAVHFIGRDMGGLGLESYCNGKELTLKKGSESSVTHTDEIPKDYTPNHVCINETIEYKCYGKLPTHGPHRPNWASFGQYR